MRRFTSIVLFVLAISILIILGIIFGDTFKNNSTWNQIVPPNQSELATWNPIAPPGVPDFATWNPIAPPGVPDVKITSLT